MSNLFFIDSFRVAFEINAVEAAGAQCSAIRLNGFGKRLNFSLVREEMGFEFGSEDALEMLRAWLSLSDTAEVFEHPEVISFFGFVDACISANLSGIQPVISLHGSIAAQDVKACANGELDIVARFNGVDAAGEHDWLDVTLSVKADDRGGWYWLCYQRDALEYARDLIGDAKCRMVQQLCDRVMSKHTLQPNH